MVWGPILDPQIVQNLAIFCQLCPPWAIFRQNLHSCFSSKTKYHLIFLEVQENVRNLDNRENKNYKKIPSWNKNYIILWFVCILYTLISMPASVQLFKHIFFIIKLQQKSLEGVNLTLHVYNELPKQSVWNKVKTQNTC